MEIHHINSQRKLYLEVELMAFIRLRVIFLFILTNSSWTSLYIVGFLFPAFCRKVPSFLAPEPIKFIFFQGVLDGKSKADNIISCLRKKTHPIPIGRTSDLKPVKKWKLSASAGDNCSLIDNHLLIEMKRSLNLALEKAHMAFFLSSIVPCEQGQDWKRYLCSK